MIIILSHWKFVGKAWTQSSLKSTTSRCEKVCSWQVTITESETMLFFRKMITVLNLEVWDIECVWKLWYTGQRPISCYLLVLVMQHLSTKHTPATLLVSSWTHRSEDAQCVGIHCSYPLFDTQSVHILASGSQFKLSRECSQHSPSSLW